MFRHVLIAVDFSPATAILIARLRALRELGATHATFIHVLSTRYPSAPAETHRAQYEARLADLADEFSESGMTVQGRIQTGEPAYELVQAAADVGADLILAGTRGYSRWRELFLGSTALDLARLTDRPLWLEPMTEDAESDEKPSAIARFNSALLATDGSDAAKPAEAMFVQLAQRVERAIALHVIASSEGGGQHAEPNDAGASLAKVAAQVKGLDTRIIKGDPSEVIAETACHEDVDLVIVGKRGRSPIHDLLLGSTAEAVCRRSRRPVLLVPAGRT